MVGTVLHKWGHLAGLCWQCNSQGPNGKMSVRDHFRVKKLISAHGFGRCRFIVSGRQGGEAPRKEDLLGLCCRRVRGRAVGAGDAAQVAEGLPGSGFCLQE